MTDVTIETTFGKVRFSYNSSEELTAALQGIEQQIGIIQETAERISPVREATPKAGCEEIYRFLPSGHLELFRFPSEGTKLAALALYAYHPEMVTAEILELVTGIEGIKAGVLGQTKNRKYFRKLDDQYGLSREGFKLVIEDVLPSLSAAGNPPAEVPPVEEEPK